MKRIGLILIAILLVQTLLLMAAETTWYGPHLTDRSPWINKIVLYNTGDTETAATLTVWNEAGTIIHDIDVTIPALDQITYVLTSYDGYVVSATETQISAVQGTFQVTTEDESVVPLLSFQYGDNPSITQFFLTKEMNTGYLLPNTGTDHFDWTGLAMANGTDTALTVNLKAVREGVVVDETTTDIPARGKLVATSDALWSGLDILDFYQVQVRANGPFPAPILITGNDAQDRHLFFSGKGIPVTVTSSASFTVVDTNQSIFYDDTREIAAPNTGESFHGQDAGYIGNIPSYTDNGDGTVTDTVTGLMWQQDHGDKMTYAQAVAGADTFSLAGYDDWRLPTIKELYSLILFSGVDPSGYEGTDTSGLIPFIDDIFDFQYGDTSAGERIIDSQFATNSMYVDTTMNGDETDFGVNFADGRIKGYGIGPLPGQTTDKMFHVLYVRDNPGYGINNFVDNGDGTVTDTATGLMWMQVDSGHLGAGDAMDGTLNWEQALAFAENLEYADYDDWRLPDAKELQGIVDYTRSPGTTGTAAIDPVFSCSGITNEAGQADFPFYWTGTTHANWTTNNEGSFAAYVCFGRAMGYMNGTWMDVHGAGAQRSDPKSGDPADYPTGHGPQGDAIRIYNHVRCVRTAN